MTVKSFYDTLKAHNIPDDATIIVDSGWEISDVPIICVYYCPLQNLILLGGESCINFKIYDRHPDKCKLLYKEDRTFYNENQYLNLEDKTNGKNSK